MQLFLRFARRRFLQMAAGAAAVPIHARTARAASYPSRPVRYVVSSAAGGTQDILARLIGQWLSQRLGQPFVIENRPGGGTNIATEMVARAEPDGYTLLSIAPANAINVTLYAHLSFDFSRDIAPVAGMTHEPYVMLVHASVPARTVAEFIAFAKAHPGKLNMASAGRGTGTHVAGELFKMMTGVDLIHVPYRGGGPALTDMITGQVQVYFSNLSPAIAYIRDGRLRALAVTTAARTEALPDVPVLADVVPGYEASAWLGLGAPRGTPATAIDKLNKAINAALADRTIKSRIAHLGGTPIPGSAADFGKLIAAETAKWAKVVRFAGLAEHA
jgi:tripartite-type tricarboxylate transporter receptor subunit TctC